MKNGFTLIELLVVVLIIGVLASVALPDYQRAAEKAKWMEAVVAVKALKDAQDRYFLVNDAYTTNLNDLDVSVKTTGNSFTFYIHTSPLNHIEAKRNGVSRWLTKYYDYPDIFCGAANSDTVNKNACAVFTGAAGEPCPEAGYTCYPLKN